MRDNVMCGIHKPSLSSIVPAVESTLWNMKRSQKMATEKRMIDAYALMDVIRKHEYPVAARLGSIDNGMFTVGIQQAVDEQPTVDAVEVVHGRWKKNWHNSLIGHEYEECSICGCMISDTEKFWDCNYCPNCGAKMNGEEV